MVKYTPPLIREKVNKTMCVERSRSFNFIPSRSLDLFDQQNIVLTRNIRHNSDIYHHVYHLDHHKKNYFIIKSLFSIHFAKH